MKEKPQKTQKLKKAKFFDFKQIVFDFVRITGVLPTLLALRPKYYYASKAAKKKVKGGALFVANHNNYLDPVRMYLAVWYRRVNLVAIKNLFQSKAGNWFFRSCACVPVDPDRPSLKTVNEVVERLKEGKAVGIFPEGHINRTEQPLQEFKSGVLLMAMRANAPIVPVYFKPTEHWYNRHKIAIGEPVSLNELASGEHLTLEEMEQATTIVQERVRALMNIIK